MPDNKLQIACSLKKTSFAYALIALSGSGVFSIELSKSAQELKNTLESDFKNFYITHPNGQNEEIIRKVIRILEDPFLDADDIVLDMHGTDFQKKVWQELHKIPAGKTCSYQALAEAVGNADAVRAVASAVAANRHAVLIPCHRVIHKDGSLGGFRWGLEMKKMLLYRERTEGRENLPPL